MVPVAWKRRIRNKYVDTPVRNLLSFRPCRSELVNQGIAKLPTRATTSTPSQLEKAAKEVVTKDRSLWTIGANIVTVRRQVAVSPRQPVTFLEGIVAIVDETTLVYVSRPVGFTVSHLVRNQECATVVLATMELEPLPIRRVIQNPSAIFLPRWE